MSHGEFLLKFSPNFELIVASIVVQCVKVGVVLCVTDRCCSVSRDWRFDHYNNSRWLLYRFQSKFSENFFMAHVASCK